MPKHRTLNHDFFKKWGREMAYVLGYIAADAAITIGKRGNHYLDIQSIDPELPKTVGQLLGANHAISRRKRKAKWHTVYRLQVGSKEIVSDLGHLGLVPRKTKRLILPRVPSQFFGDFVRGYFDGDGNVNWTVVKRKDRPGFARHLHVVFTSCSGEFLGMLHHRLREEFNLEGGSFHQAPGVFRLLYAGHDSLRLFKVMYRYPTAPSLKRKFEYFNTAVKKFVSKNNTGR